MPIWSELSNRACAPAASARGNSESITGATAPLCSNGQTLKKIELKWYRINSSGTEEEYFRHTLEDVKITSVKPTMHNVKDLDKERYPHLEEVACRYGKVTWTYVDGNISFSDSWTEGR